MLPSRGGLSTPGTFGQHGLELNGHRNLNGLATPRSQPLQKFRNTSHSPPPHQHQRGGMATPRDTMGRPYPQSPRTPTQGHRGVRDRETSSSRGLATSGSAHAQRQASRDLHMSRTPAGPLRVPSRSGSQQETPHLTASRSLPPSQFGFEEDQAEVNSRLTSPERLYSGSSLSLQPAPSLERTSSPCPPRSTSPLRHGGDNDGVSGGTEMFEPRGFSDTKSDFGSESVATSGSDHSFRGWVEVELRKLWERMSMESAARERGFAKAMQKIESESRLREEAREKLEVYWRCLLKDETIVRSAIMQSRIQAVQSDVQTDLKTFSRQTQELAITVTQVQESLTKELETHRREHGFVRDDLSKRCDQLDEELSKLHVDSLPSWYHRGSEQDGPQGNGSSAEHASLLKLRCELLDVRRHCDRAVGSEAQARKSGDEEVVNNMRGLVANERKHLKEDHQALEHRVESRLVASLQEMRASLRLDAQGRHQEGQQKLEEALAREMKARSAADTRILSLVEDKLGLTESAEFLDTRSPGSNCRGTVDVKAGGIASSFAGSGAIDMLRSLVADQQAELASSRYDRKDPLSGMLGGGSSASGHHCRDSFTSLGERGHQAAKALVSIQEELATEVQPLTPRK